MSFESEHDARVRERVEKLMVGAQGVHTIEEIRRRLEKIHGVRFSKSDVLAALGTLKKFYELQKIDRSFPSEPQYRLRELPAKQIPLFGAQQNASN